MSEYLPPSEPCLEQRKKGILQGVVSDVFGFEVKLEGSHTDCNYLARNGFCDKCGWYVAKDGGELGNGHTVPSKENANEGSPGPDSC